MSTLSNDYAIYLPAVNLNYAKTIASEVPDGRPFPSDLSLGDFAFWEEGSKLWHHPHFLHSVGQYSVGADPDNAVTRRGPEDGVLFGDSAGFQIGKGSLRGFRGLRAGMTADAACDVWRNNETARAWIVNWLETYTNYAMTIDMPLWATLPEEFGSPFHKCSHEQLLTMTVESLKFVDRNRQGQTKWLNVIQGLDISGMQKWWNAVKWFECSGYALSAKGATRNGLRTMLEPLLVMRDDKAFDEGRDWIHVLGCSTAPWAIVCTAIQRAIQSTSNPNLRVSFDSSSPFLGACRYGEYNFVPLLNSDQRTWSIGKEKMPKRASYIGSDDPVPFSSPLADELTLGDFNVREGNFEKNRFDAFSDLFLMNHNIWVYLQTFKTANDLVFASDRARVPNDISECAAFIEEVFLVENWQERLSKNQKLLDGFKG
jgi:hypothetical protein